MTSFRKRKISFWISSVTLLSAVLVLLYFGLNEWLKKRTPQIHTFKPVRFGVAQGTQMQIGRDPSMRSLAEGLPIFSRSLIQKIDAAFQNTDTTSANALLLELERQHGQIPVVAYIKAKQILGQRQVSLTLLQNASALLQAALRQDPTHPLLLKTNGEVLWLMGKKKDAIAEWELARELSPMYADVWILLGRWHRQDENFSESEKELRTAISIKNPYAAPAAAELALLYYQTGNTDSVSALLQYAHQMSWKSDTLIWVQGLLLEEQGELARAESIYRQLLKKDSTHVGYLQALQSLGQKPLQSLLVQASPHDSVTWTKATDAIEILDPLTRAYGQNAPLWLALGQAYMRAGLYGHALKAFDTALVMDTSMLIASTYRDSVLTLAALRERIQNPIKAIDSNVASSAPSMDLSPLSVYDASSTGTQKGVRPSIYLGHYLVHWNSFSDEILTKYGAQGLSKWKPNFLKQSFTLGTIKHQYILGLTDDKLWGIGVMIVDTTKKETDLLGKILRQNYSYSGQGEETGWVTCGKFREFEGVVWENEDTMELMGRFKGTPWQVRMARLSRDILPDSPKLCQLVAYLDTDKWGSP